MTAADDLTRIRAVLAARFTPESRVGAYATVSQVIAEIERLHRIDLAANRLRSVGGSELERHYPNRVRELDDAFGGGPGS